MKSLKTGLNKVRRLLMYKALSGRKVTYIGQYFDKWRQISNREDVEMAILKVNLEENKEA